MNKCCFRDAFLRPALAPLLLPNPQGQASSYTPQVVPFLSQPQPPITDHGQGIALRAHCVCTAWALRAYCACRGRDTHPRIPVT